MEPLDAALLAAGITGMSLRRSLGNGETPTRKELEQVLENLDSITSALAKAKRSKEAGDA
jgi:hypothetical protein